MVILNKGIEIDIYFLKILKTLDWNR